VEKESSIAPATVPQAIKVEVGENDVVAHRRIVLLPPIIYNTRVCVLYNNYNNKL